MLLYIVTVALGWWLIVTLLATWRARAAGERPFGRSPAASLVVLAIVVAVEVAAATILALLVSPWAGLAAIVLVLVAAAVIASAARSRRALRL